MRYSKEDCLEQLVDNAIKSTLRRTAITSLTTLITIVAIGVMAGEVLGGFALSLGIGVVIGTFSSLSIAATLPLILKLPRDAYNQLETSHTESQVTQM
jgi:preprotein translocase subunit SecF